MVTVSIRVRTRGALEDHLVRARGTVGAHVQARARAATYPLGSKSGVKPIPTPI